MANSYLGQDDSYLDDAENKAFSKKQNGIAGIPGSTGPKRAAIADPVSTPTMPGPIGSALAAIPAMSTGAARQQGIAGNLPADFRDVSNNGGASKNPGAVTQSGKPMGIGQMVNGVQTFNDATVPKSFIDSAGAAPNTSDPTNRPTQSGTFNGRLYSGAELDKLAGSINTVPSESFTRPGVGTLGMPVSADQGISMARQEQAPRDEDMGGISRLPQGYDPTAAARDYQSDLGSIMSKDPRSIAGTAAHNAAADRIWDRNTGPQRGQAGIANRQAADELYAQKMRGIDALPKGVFDAQNQAGNENARDQAQYGIAGLMSNARLASSEARNNALMFGASARADAMVDSAKIKANADGIGALPGIGGGDAAQPVHGDDFLKSLSPTTAAQVKALADGRMEFPSGTAIKSPYWQQMLSSVAAYDPSFEAANYKARAATRKDFTSGKAAQSINALNTVSGHLGELSDAAKALNNFGGMLSPLNGPKNYIESKLGDARLPKFETTKKALVDELTRAYRGSGGSEADIKTWSDALNSSQSPEQLQAVSGQINKLLHSKIAALGDQYRQGMGTIAGQKDFISPHAHEAFDRVAKRSGIPVDSSGIDASSQPAKASSASGQGSGIPQAAIDHLRQNPALRDTFDSKYGRGASAGILGN